MSIATTVAKFGKAEFLLPLFGSSYVLAWTAQEVQNHYRFWIEGCHAIFKAVADHVYSEKDSDYIACKQISGPEGPFSPLFVVASGATGIFLAACAIKYASNLGREVRAKLTGPAPTGKVQVKPRSS